MSTIGFYPIDVTYKIVNDATHTYIFGRTTDNRQICVIDTAIQPYFYIVPQDNTVINEIMSRMTNLTIERNGYESKVKKTEVVEANYRGRQINVIKATVNIPKAAAVLRDPIKNIQGVKEILEADIQFANKYWIDRQLTPLELLKIDCEPSNENLKVPAFKATRIEHDDGNLQTLKTLAFDIETYNPLGKTMLPDQFPILMISFYGEGFKKVITWKRFKTDLDYIEFVDGEGQLIEKFKEVLEEYSPDALVGYYSDGFDLPYIMTRAEKHKIKLDIGLDYSTPRKSRGFKTEVETKGIIHIDVLNFVRKISRRLATETLKLDDIAYALLGERKEEVQIDKLAEAWDSSSQELEKFCSYNLKDSRLTHDIFMKLLPNITELVRLIGQPLQSLERMGYGQLAEWYLMKRSIEFDHLLIGFEFHKRSPGQPNPIPFECLSLMSEIETGHFDVLLVDVLPNIHFGPV